MVYVGGGKRDVEHRNISSQYYYRLLQSQTKDMIIDEMKRITAPMQGDKLEFI